MSISVALCTYNGQDFIKEQIDSILNQSLPVTEIIICDDRSTDDTIQILENYSSQNPGVFKIHINETNLRSVKNFEKAVTLCTGDFIFLSDQDDIWALNKVEEYIKYFENNANIDVLASNGYCINEKSEVEKKYAIWDVPQFLRDEGIKFSYYSLIINVGNLATGASMAFRKSILKKILPFPVIKDFHHDEWIAIIASKKNKFELLNEKYFYYRIHRNQQVGGVFYHRTQKKKKELTNLFNLYEGDPTLVIIKRRLKKLVLAYDRNKSIIEKSNAAEGSIFHKNLDQVEKTFNKVKRFMKKKYPFIASVLHVTDKILDKRQLRK